MSMRDKIIDQTVRFAIMEEPHRYIFSEMIRKNSDFTVEIYMFGYQPYKLIIKYDYVTKDFNVYRKVSPEYVERFG